MDGRWISFGSWLKEVTMANPIFLLQAMIVVSTTTVNGKAAFLNNEILQDWSRHWDLTPRASAMSMEPVEWYRTKAMATFTSIANIGSFSLVDMMKAHQSKKAS